MLRLIRKERERETAKRSKQQKAKIESTNAQC